MYVQKSVSALVLISLIGPMLLTPLTTAHAYTAEVPIAERQSQPESIQVKPDATGSNAYSIPLTLPPGRNGVQPSLALTYSSNSSDNTSTFGYGWGISIPSISRLQKEGINKLYTVDAFTSSIDGELVLVTAGSPAVYRPKYDSGAYNKYELNNNVWTVTAKDGTAYTFGATAASRMDDPANSAQIYEWKLSEIRDTNDNFARYTYYKDDGQIYPDTIYYTGKGSTDGIFAVEFQREVRTDKVPSYRTQFKVLSNYRIKNVTVKKSGVWVRKYALGYGTGANGVRSMLTSVTESGRDEQGNIVTLPATLLEYQAPSTGWTTESSWGVPALVTPNGQYQNIDNGSRFADLNGDGMQDYAQTVYNAGASAAAQYTAFGKGNGWSPNYPYPVTFPTMFRVYNDGGIPDAGTRFGDLNGDGKDDAVRLYGNPGNQGDMTNRKVYENSGTAFTEATGYTIPVFNFSEDVNSTTGTMLLDLNGDGRGDLVNTSEAYLFGNGVTTGWQTNTSYSVTQPYGIGRIVNTADFNADGLVDYQHDVITQTSPSYVYTPRLLYFTGTSFQDSGAALTTPASDHYVGDMGVRSLDVNNDGLTDIVQSKEGASCGAPTCPLMQSVHINTGIGFTSSTYVLPSVVYFARVTSTGSGVVYTDSGERIIDVDGDMLADLVGPMGAYRNTGKRADILTKVTVPQGGTISYTYKTSLQYKDAQGNILSTGAPYPVYVVDTVTTNDGQGFADTKTYKYEGGFQYYAAYNDKQFGGFSVVTATDSVGNYTKTYYHQGNTTNTALGEFSDHPSKIGRVYRVERYNASNALLSVELQKWESVAQGSRFIVNNTETKVLTYEGDSSHRDRAVTRTFDTANNNLLTETDWGEVTAAVDGTYTDIGSDKTTVEYTYATDAAGKILNKSSKKVIKNQSNTIVGESKSTYDGLSWGTVSTGNETKTEQLISGTTYATTTRAFNTYGLITSVTNPRNYTTTFTYDAHNLYPATSTNALTHGTTYQYNQSVGKPKLVTDANGFQTETTYDGLGRVTQVRVSDIASPTTLVPVQQYTYTDTRNAVSVYEKTLLTGALFQDSYTYTDGFGRQIQKRISSEAGQYSVSDTVYGRDGLVTSQSLPYFSVGGGKTSALGNSALTTTFTYDALGRQITAANVSGAITTTYTDWKKTVVDQLGKTKSYETDAKGNLTKVTEYISATPYNTTYSYDTLNNLASITDAQGNIRAFTYDAQSRRTSAEDLHAPADTTYGTWGYTYDAQGNKTQEVQPKGTIVNYTYDALDRLATEDAPSTGGTDIVYTYDTGTYGKGRMTNAVKGTTTSAYTYTIRGDVASESKAIGGETFVTAYDYNRRGDVTTITTPDNAQVRYSYNTAGQIEKIERKESGGAWTPVVTNYNYGPHGKITTKKNANNTWTYNTYDPNELYRLRNISTIDPPAEVPVEEQAAALTVESVPAEVSEPAQATQQTEPAAVETPAVVENQSTEAAPQEILPDVPAELVAPTTVFAETKTDTALTPPLEAVVQKVAEETLLVDATFEAPSDNIEELEALESLAHEGERELKALRTDTSYTIQVSRDTDGVETRTTRLFTKPVHFSETKDGGTKGKRNWKPIDTRLKQTTDAFETVSGPFGVRIPKNGEEGLTTVTVGALSVSLEVVADDKKKKNTDDAKQLRALRKKESEKRIVETKDAITPGVSVSMKTDTTGVRKDIVITDASALKELSENGEYYEIPFKLVVTEGTVMTVEGAQVGEVPVETKEIITLTHGTDSLYVRPAYIHDAGIEVAQIPLAVQKTDGGFLLTKRIPKTWFEKVTYPVTTDAVLSYYSDVSDLLVGNTTGNGWAATRSSTSGTWSSTSESSGPRTMNAGGNWFAVDRSFYNFNTATLPDDAVIGSAVFKVAYNSGYTSDGMSGIALTPSTITNPTSVTTADYGQVQDTLLSNINYISSGYQVGTYIPFALSTSGLSAVNKTGWTKLALRMASDISNTSVNGLSYSTYYFSEATGTSMDPYLEVTYTVPTIPPTGMNLKVEGLSNPTSVNTGTPKFTATFNDPDEVDSGAHYQLQVVADTGDFASPLWDSTKTALSPKLNQGDATPQITYGGAALALNNQKYKWRIKFWDDSGTEGPWTDGNDTFIVAPIVTATADMYVGCATAQSGTLNPEGVKCVAPTFSSVYNIGTSGTTANKYRVQVATTNDFSTGIVWDSGSAGTTFPNTAWNARTTDIVYRGDTLAMNGTRYYWRIKYWTTGNVESSWSPVGTFTTFSSRVYQNINYTYDAAGNITNLTDGSDLQSKKSAAYTYDDLYRLTNAAITNSAAGATDYTQSYTYDILGNITNKSDIGAYSYAGTGKANPHAATSVGGTAYTYDDNGNVLTDGTRAFSWNYDNTVATVVKGGVTTTYAYDHARGRVSQGNGTVTTKYPNKYYNIDSTGKKTKHIFAGDQAVATIETVGSTVTPRYMHSDQLGSSSVITTETVQYNHPPRIALLGTSSQIINVNDSYVESGATAYDDEDGQITPSVVVTGTIDTATAGSYQKTYTVTDSGGATATIIRNIVVRAPNGADTLPQASLDWKLNGTYDSTPKHANTGSVAGYALTNGGSYTSVAGKLGDTDGAVSLNGTASQYLSTSVYNPSSTFTFGARFKKTGGSSIHYIFYDGDTTGSNQIGIHIRPDNRIACEMNGNSAISYSVNVYDWVDVACVKSGNTMYIYVNGTYHANGNASGQTTITGTAYIGRVSYTNNFGFNGAIDGVRLYDGVAFTALQAAGMFALPSNNPPTLTLTNNTYPQVVQLGTTYTDPGATASDPEDGTLTTSVSVTGTVDTATLGTYTRTYSVTDAGGLTTKQARTVVVVPTGNLMPTEAEVTDYYPYGGQRLRVGAFTEQKKFTGYEYDTDAGLSYAQARYYNQDTGRFSSQDPAYLRLGTRSQSDTQLLLDPQQQNSYNYARGNPLRYTDPTGEYVALLGRVAVMGGSRIWAAMVAYLGATALSQPEAMNALENMVSAGNGMRFENQFTPPPQNPNDYKDPRSNLTKFGKAGWVTGLVGVTSVGVYMELEPYLQSYDQLRIQSELNSRLSFNSYLRNSSGIDQKAFSSYSTNQRYEVVQNYNSYTSSSTPQGNLYVTPNGAVVNWSGGVIVPGSNKSKPQ